MADDMKRKLRNFLPGHEAGDTGQLPSSIQNSNKNDSGEASKLSFELKVEAHRCTSGR